MEDNIRFVLFSNCNNLMKGFTFLLIGATPFRRFKETLFTTFASMCWVNASSVVVIQTIPKINHVSKGGAFELDPLFAMNRAHLAPTVTHSRYQLNSYVFLKWFDSSWNALPVFFNISSKKPPTEWPICQFPYKFCSVHFKT